MDNRENINWNEEIEQLREQVRSQEARIAALEAELAGMRQMPPHIFLGPKGIFSLRQARKSWEHMQKFLAKECM